MCAHVSACAFEALQNTGSFSKQRNCFFLKPHLQQQWPLLWSTSESFCHKGFGILCWSTHWLSLYEIHIKISALKPFSPSFRRRHWLKTFIFTMQTSQTTVDSTGIGLFLTPLLGICIYDVWKLFNLSANDSTAVTLWPTLLTGIHSILNSYYCTVRWVYAIKCAWFKQYANKRKF